jgi:hypothetical protein
MMGKIKYFYLKKHGGDKIPGGIPSDLHTHPLLRINYILRI